MAIQIIAWVHPSLPSYCLPRSGFLCQKFWQTFARGAKPCPKFRADFTPVGYDFSEILDLSEGAHGVENSKDGDTYVGEDGEPHRGETEGSEDQYGHLDANSKPDVLTGY